MVAGSCADVEPRIEDPRGGRDGGDVRVLVGDGEFGDGADEERFEKTVEVGSQLIPIFSTTEGGGIRRRI